VNLSGRFVSLEPIRNLKELTHANILGCRVKSLQPLSGLSALREFYITTDSKNLDLSPLKALESLHRLSACCNGTAPRELDHLRASLSPWDIEFRAESPRYSPSLRLHVVDQQTFDIFDTQKPFNLSDADTNEGLLESELEWLDGKIDRLLSSDLRAGEDYAIPHHWNRARSRTIVLYSDASVASLAKLVLGIQEVLSNAKQDWIIYLQTDGVRPEFIVWVYPDKIMVTHEHEDAIRKLVESNRGVPKR
jgi:hypothetical protein